MELAVSSGPVTSVVSVALLFVSSDSLMVWSGSMEAVPLMVVSWQGAMTVTLIVATSPEFRVPKSQVTSCSAGRKQVPCDGVATLIPPELIPSRTTTPSAGP